MNIQNLNKGWKMYMSGKEDEILPACVPGSVYNDLLINNKIEDPFWRDNELKALPIMDNDFVYEASFSADDEISEFENVILCFDGIDTLADIFLNDIHVGSVNNMHIKWEYDVKEILKKENLIKIHFHSPTKYVTQKYEKKKIKSTTNAMMGFPYLRKAHYMFGWDWGPRLPDMGIWKDVKLIAYNTARIDNVYITQEHKENEVVLKLDIELEEKFSRGLCGISGYDFKVVVKDPDGKEIFCGRNTGEICIKNPLLWWPNGIGGQPLYTVCVYLEKEDTLLDSWEKRIGLRTLDMHIEKDEYGESFAHRINGVDIFAMGANYIPEDNILSRMNGKRTHELLLQAKNANYNTVRVWGGGFYPSDEFFDACDEYGLLVWHDLMFACAAYDLDEEFEESITKEIIGNIKRIRHHACLALWCGNNEMEQEEKAFTCKERADYIKMYEYIFPKLIKKYDPNTFYWPSSPSSGGNFDEPTAENRGDVHDWSVWHGDVPFTEYRKHKYRYLSEFGFQSFPSLKTCESFTLPEDRNIFSYVMEKHQRNSVANGRLVKYMEQIYLYPENFDDLIYATQLLQAEAIKYGVEHFRRIRGICMGTVVWQLNDCWPVASWSSVDYYGRWKALHYYEKRCFAPLAISCEEEGILTQDTNPNAQPYKIKKSIRLCVTNETPKDEEVTVSWELRDSYSDIKGQGEKSVLLPAFSSVWLEKEDMSDADLYEDYVSFSMKKGGKIISEGTVIFSMPKYFKLKNPQISLKTEGDEIVVTSKAYAKAVEIINEDDTLLLEDNYFDMNKGERRIKILKGTPKGLKVRSVYNIGRRG